MGRSKLDLPVGTSTVLECLVGTLRENGIQSVFVVLAPGENRLSALASRASAAVIQLTEPTSNMRETVTFGLQELLERGHAAPDDSWMLVPADHPALTATSLRVLLDAYKRGLNHAIFIPTFEEKRGHPTILPFSILRRIEELEPNEGINHLLRRLVDQTALVPVTEPSILWDLDTEEDYTKLLEHYGHAPR